MRKFVLGMMFLLPLILSSKIEVLEESPYKILLKFQIEDYSFSDNGRYTFINCKELVGSGETGAPFLPRKSINIAVPPDGSVEMKVVSKRETRRNLQYPLAPVPKIIKNGKTSDEVYEINPNLYGRAEKKIVKIGEKTNYRLYEIIPMEIYPFLYDFSQNAITILDEIILQIDIKGNTKFYQNIQDDFDEIYRELILNYKTAKYWQNQHKREINHFDFTRSDFWYKIEIPSAGIYELNFNELKMLPSFCNSASLRLFTGFRLKEGDKKSKFEIREIPLFISANEEDNFQKNDFIRFEFSFPENAGFFGNAVCWLTFGGNFSGTPLRDVSLAERKANSVLNFKRYYPKNILGKRRGLDALIIYPAEFEEFADSLKNLHQRESGIVSETIDQEYIFDQFGETPEGVRDYIESRYNENPELEYVILLGSGTEDWELSIPKNKIITFNGSDDGFVDFNSDNRPELSIGRIPAQNISQMELIFERIKKYMEEPNLGWWRNNVLIMADDENKSDHLEGLSDGDGLNHTYLAQEAEDAINPAVFTEKVLGLEYDFDEYHNKPEAREAMIEKINAGVLVWYFIGHGNEDVLGDEEYFRGSLHMNLLKNEEKLPLFLAASCEVGMFDSPEIDCIAEKLLYNESGGSIASIASTRVCGGSPNTTLLKYFLVQILNNRNNVGKALVSAKINSGATLTNSRKFNLMGDPLLYVIPPQPTEIVSELPDSLRAKETITVHGDFENSSLSGTGEFRVFGSKYEVFYSHTLGTQTYSVYYKKNRRAFYNGRTEINEGEYITSFIIPMDIDNGEEGKIICYSALPEENLDFTNYYYPLKLSDDAIDAVSSDSPSIQIWLDSKRFISGDYVSTTPQLIAAISDSNGINISGSAGHKILMILDNANEPVDVTDYFVYEIDSYTTGELRYRLDNISEGNHKLELMVFDNFNVPAIASTEFIAKKSGEVAIEKVLPFPNPMEKDGYFTFIITEDADVTISVYTISGKKIRTIKVPNCSAGYNQVYWDGKDGDGDTLANNTYFYKIKASQKAGNKFTEKIGKVIIFK